MRLSRIRIENFRNFHELDVTLGDSIVVLGENTIGKSNLIHALRLVLDPALPDAARDLRIEDLWDGLGDEPKAEDRILISIDLAEFEDNESQLAVLAEHLVEPSPMVARLTYVWQPKAGLEGPPRKDGDYEWFIYGGDRPENKVGYEIRRSIPLDVLHALRDCEGDLARWVRSPLRPLLDKAASEIERDTLESLADDIDSATEAVTKVEQIEAATKSINDKLTDMVGSAQALETALRFSPADADRLIRSLRMYIDGGKRSISDASLGSANVLYLALKTLEYEQLAGDGQREHTFLAIEEPEAHLHPHLQRLVFANYLKPRTGEGNEPSNSTVILTTHSTHIASVTPLRSFLLLKGNDTGDATIGVSTAKLKLTEEELADLERYIDATRAEILFSRGVLLVEGEAERFVVPVLAEKIGVPLDELGISVCAIAGTAFGPYLRLVGPKGLDLPYAVLTDRDQQVTNKKGAKKVISHGYARYRRTWRKAIGKPPLAVSIDAAGTRADAETHGVFFNDSTFEVELFEAGYHDAFRDVAHALSSNEKLKARFAHWSSQPTEFDKKQFLKDIETISKGRFAQRLAAVIAEHKSTSCPAYIQQGIKHVAGQCT